MNLLRYFPRHEYQSFVLRVVVFLVLAAMHGASLHAQDAAQAPMTPPPEHRVTRIGNVSEPQAPPSLPEAETITRFSAKEDQYILERTHFTYRKPLRIQEFGADGQPSG